jgi:hypothetical protein
VARIRCNNKIPTIESVILFQIVRKTRGHALQLWEMNGTNVAATLDLPSRGAGWQSVNGHPFATR